MRWWRSEPVLFTTIEEAEEHLLLVHPGRFLTMYRATFGTGRAEHRTIKELRAEAVTDALFKRNE